MGKHLPVRQLNSRGFTLIELMVVIVILGILAGLIVPKIMNRPDDAKKVMARAQIQSIETALKLYKLDTGKYPTTEQGLQALIQAPPDAKNWRKEGYLDKNKVPSDPWNNEFVYLSPGMHGDYDLICYGADGMPEGDDANKDITSWDTEK